MKVRMFRPAREFCITRDLLPVEELHYDWFMGTLAIELRKAGLEDAGAIAAVHDESWENAYAGIVPHSALIKMIRRRGPGWWANAIRRSTCILVLEIDGKVAGYATLGRNRVKTLPHQGEIYEIYLRPDCQGVGLGTRLFLAARAELMRRSLKGTVVWVLAENERAISFYANAGGKRVAEGTEVFDGKKLVKYAYSWD
jgi:ribosomal protein S18 acetylase RimI-like enzyme